MTDLAKPYRGVTHFGVWAEDGADDLGKRDALAILHSAIEAARDRDMRHDRELMDTLDWLIEQSGTRRAIIQRFRAALDVPHPVTRCKALAAAYRAICKAVAT